MPTARVIVTKEIDYRQTVERFSNGYRFNLPTIDEATIRTLALALRDWERPMHAGSVRFVYLNGGRDAPGAQSVYVEEFENPLVGGSSAVNVHPETVIMAESKRRQRVYARKFFHTLNAQAQDSSTPERLSQQAIDFFNGRLATLTDGSLPDGARYCWPDGTALAEPFTLDPYLRVRQFDRRGKRPTQAPPQG